MTQRQQDSYDSDVIDTIVPPSHISIESTNQKINEFTDFLLHGLPDEDLRDLIVGTLTVLYEAYKRNMHRWIITFSGGKDSTTVLVLSLEILKNYHLLGWRPDQIDIIFSDTLLELPPVITQVENILSYVDQISQEHNLPVTIHRVAPKLEHRFWYNILAKGYPPPHNRFRWCTDRLKINPSEAVVKKVTMVGPAVILTGVRYAESDARTARLNAACSKGGECGQGVWFDRSKNLNTDYLAPIAEWTTCKIWDFLSFVAPCHGWSTGSLASLYGTEPIRFGCWTCPLVKEDRATEAVVKREAWSHLKPLQDMRSLLISVGRSMNADDRLLRKDGRVGKISLERRQHLYQELRRLEKQVGVELLDPVEATAIETYWISSECLEAIAISDEMKGRKQSMIHTDAHPGNCKES